MKKMPFKLLYDGEIPDPHERKHKRLKPTSKREPTEGDGNSEDNTDVSNIRKSVSETLEYLNGKSYGNYYSVKVTPTKDNCFRVIVFNKHNRKVLSDFFVEKGGPGEYVFTPPLDIMAFTTGSYENRTTFQKNS
jgi:hypothetical protein